MRQGCECEAIRIFLHYLFSRMAVGKVRSICAPCVGQVLCMLSDCSRQLDEGFLLFPQIPEDALRSLLKFDWLAGASTGSPGASLPSFGGLWESGEWWMLLAAQSMAVGTVMVRWVSKHVDPVVATGWVSGPNVSGRMFCLCRLWDLPEWITSICWLITHQMWTQRLGD
jgi:hypothetical protein